MVRSVVEVLFPPTCAGCGAGVASGTAFCAACWSAVGVVLPPGCLRCDRPLEAEVERCADCPPPELAWARSALLYEGPVRRALMRLKFGRLRSVGPALSPWLMLALERGPPAVGAAATGQWVLTWVPLGPRRKRRRGYDQAQVLARALAEESGWPLLPLLRRRIETAPQAKQSGAQRRLALSGAFSARACPPPRVVLVDDVLTSGATATECTRVLLRAGARDVGLVTAARSLGGPVPARCYNTVGPRPGSVVARGTFPR